MSPLQSLRAAASASITGVGAGPKPAGGEKQGAASAGRSATASQGGISVEVSQDIAAGEAPIDGSRVAEIRDALRDGSYPILPAKIADAMIAARLMLGYAE